MFPDLKVVSNDQNLGFAAAANQACKHTASRWLTIVNPDVGCCGVPAVHADGTVNDRSFFVRPTLWSEITLSFAVHQFARASRFLNPEQYIAYRPSNAPVEVHAVTGCFMVLDQGLFSTLYQGLCWLTHGGIPESQRG